MSIRLRYWLIGLALFFGQGLALAHALDHSGLNLQDHACQICSHGHPDTTAAANSIAPLQLASLREGLVVRPPAPASPASVEHPPIRGPPQAFL